MRLPVTILGLMLACNSAPDAEMAEAAACSTNATAASSTTSLITTSPDITGNITIGFDESTLDTSSDVSTAYESSTSLDEMQTSTGGTTSSGDTEGLHSLCRDLVTLTIPNGEWLELSSPEDKAALVGVECIDGSVAIFPGVGDAVGLETLLAISGDLLATANEAHPPVAIFTGFDNLAQIGGDLKLFHAPVPTFKGLESLHTVEGDIQTIFTNLQDVHGLEGLHTVGGSLLLGNCGWDSLSEEKDTSEIPSLAGLENLSAVGDFLDVASSLIVDLSLPDLASVGWFRVCNAGSLVQVSLPSLAEADVIAIEHYTGYPQLVALDIPELKTLHQDLLLRGTQLVDLSGFSALTSIGSNLRLIDNEQLPTCTAESFASMLMIGGDVEIAGNLADQCGG